jgi:hypothetical protein
LTWVRFAKIWVRSTVIDSTLLSLDEYYDSTNLNCISDAISILFQKKKHIKVGGGELHTHVSAKPTLGFGACPKKTMPSLVARKHT